MTDDPAGFHGTPLTAREALLFEAGIKLGGVFHQYLGTPVGERTAKRLARTIEEAVRLQPYVRSIRVRIDPARGGPEGSGAFAYRYLIAEMLTVEVELSDGEETVRAELAHRPDLRYPLMRVVAVGPTVTRGSRSGSTRGRPVRRTGRSAGSAGGPGTPRGRGRSTRKRGSPRTPA
jgi:dihydroneopterin aldolase